MIIYLIINIIWVDIKISPPQNPVRQILLVKVQRNHNQTSRRSIANTWINTIMKWTNNSSSSTCSTFSNSWLHHSHRTYSRCIMPLITMRWIKMNRSIMKVPRIHKTPWTKAIINSSSPMVALKWISRFSSKMKLEVVRIYRSSIPNYHLIKISSNFNKFLHRTMSFLRPGKSSNFPKLLWTLSKLRIPRSSESIARA